MHRSSNCSRERISGGDGGGGGGGLFGPHNRNSIPFPDIPFPGDRNMHYAACEVKKYPL